MYTDIKDKIVILDGNEFLITLLVRNGKSFLKMEDYENLRGNQILIIRYFKFLGKHNRKILLYKYSKHRKKVKSLLKSPI